MSESSVAKAESSKPKQGTVGNRCSPRFAVVARALWPRKTAAELAFRAKVSERAAKFWLAGDRDPSLDIIMVIVDEIRGRRR